MSPERRSRLDVLRAVVDASRNAQITFLAASVAYYAFVSLVPSLLLLVVLATTVGGEAFADRILVITQGFLTPAGQESVVSAVESASGRGGVTVVSLAVLLWGALKVFRALDTAFLTVYGQAEQATFVGQLRDAVLAALAIGVGLVSMVVVGAVIAAVPLGPFGQLAGVAVLPVVLVVVFVPMYRQFPNPPIPFSEAVPGAAFAAIGWTLLQAGFLLYAASAAQYQVYGVLGGILLLVTWLYLASILVIFGAVVNAILGGRRSPGDFRSPEPGADGLTGDRQLQQGRLRRSDHMAREGTDRESPTGSADRSTNGDDRTAVSPSGAPDISELDAELDELRADLDAFEATVTDRTVEKPALEAELKRYVRARMRRGHARGWGPYLVLLYGTAMTLGAFYFFQSDALAIVAMLVIFLSTLGLYVLFVMFGVGLSLTGGPKRAIDYLRDRRN